MADCCCRVVSKLSSKGKQVFSTHLETHNYPQVSFDRFKRKDTFSREKVSYRFAALLRNIAYSATREVEKYFSVFVSQCNSVTVEQWSSVKSERGTSEARVNMKHW